MSARDVVLRIARDRLIDLLEIGDSYPLADLDITTDQLKVAYGSTAKIPVEMAQAGVSYELVDPNKGPLGAKYAADGTDDRLVIESPKVSENVTYRVRMRKTTAPPAPLDPQPYRFLTRSAPVEVGIDAALPVEFVDAPLLDLANATPSAPRVVPFNAAVGVRVRSTQEGVRYSLVIDKAPQDASVMGNLDDAVLTTPPMREDAVIQVLATKTFRASEKRPPDTLTLDRTLYLKVMADPATPVSVDPPVVDYGAATTVKIGGTQASAMYRAYLRAIGDFDFVRDAAADLSLVATPRPALQVRLPALPASWQAPAGYVSISDSRQDYAAVGAAPTPGTGGDIQIATAPLTADYVVVVEAIKEHRVGPESDSAIITSSVVLSRAVVLTRPDARRALTVRAPLGTTSSVTTLVVSGGQPGVFYSFQAKGASATLPAYFHQRDPLDPTRNKGIGQLVVGVDLAIPAGGSSSGDPATRPPDTPSVDMTSLPLGVTLTVQAVKAQTGVGVDMAWSPLEIPVVSEIRPDPDLVPAGTATKIRVVASDPLDRYQLLLNGAPVGTVVKGNGKDRTIATDPITADTVFDVVATRGDEGAVQVERAIRTAVSAGPPTA